jgi:membrane-associated phospholipid phosphatase
VTRFPVLTLPVALALVVPATSAYSQATPVPPAEPSLRTFLPDLAGDVRRLPSDPAGISVAVGGILSSSLQPFDNDIAGWVPQPGLKGGAWVGNPFALAAGTLVVYTVGAAWHKPRVRHVAVDMLRAQALALGLTYGLKYSVRRERPDRSSNDSFPSGHASETFASATVLARHAGRKAAIPAYGVAGFVALSRMNQKRHWLSDVVFGAGVGVAVGWNGSRHARGWAVTPALTPAGAAIMVSVGPSPR